MNDLTVVIPNFNKSKYIEECVKSVLKQTFLPDEVIIVDDKSTDNSREIIIRLENQNGLIRHIFLDKNSGVSNARNVGLHECKTKYITFLDSDDLYYNCAKLENEMNLLYEREKKEQFVLAYSKTVLIDSKGNQICCRQNRHFHKREFIKGKNVLYVLVSLLKQKRVPRDYCIRKAVIESVGAFSYPYDFYEDLDLLMRLAKAGVFFAPTYESGTGYRQLDGGLSHRSKESHRIAIKGICNSYYIGLSAKDKIRATFLRIVKVIIDTIIGICKQITNVKANKRG